MLHIIIPDGYFLIKKNASSQSLTLKQLYLYNYIFSVLKYVFLSYSEKIPKFIFTIYHWSWLFLNLVQTYLQ